ncbi:hypothetical protein K4H02_27220, partial [Mycobacterium tuberculosis]|nr:hypothetical protein [Mycobacterium tuberculosis]
MLEDVRGRVDKLICPADFYILDMKHDEGMSSTTIILGRPFMMTARTKIDMHSRQCRWAVAGVHEATGETRA